MVDGARVRARSSYSARFLVALEERSVARHIGHQLSVVLISFKCPLSFLRIHEMILVEPDQHFLYLPELLLVFSATEQVLMHRQEQQLVLELDELLLLLVEVDKVVRLRLTKDQLRVRVHDVAVRVAVGDGEGA